MPDTDSRLKFSVQKLYLKFGAMFIIILKHCLWVHSVYHEIYICLDTVTVVQVPLYMWDEKGEDFAGLGMFLENNQNSHGILWEISCFSKEGMK